MAAHKALSMQLRDIKPPVPIDDMSIYLYWGLMIMSIIVAAFALFFLIRFLIGLRRTNIRKTYLDALKRIDWHDPKKSAYEATRLGRLIAKEDEEHLGELYRQMVQELEAYKYKKVVEPLSTQARAQVDLFVKACDESL